MKEILKAYRRLEMSPKIPGTETNANTFNVAVISTEKQIRNLIICKSTNTPIRIHIIKILK